MSMRKILPSASVALLLCMLVFPGVVAGQFNKETKLTASDGATFDRFGFSVSIDGDTVVVGSYQDDDKGSDSGSVYVFRRTGGQWVRDQKLTANDGAAFDSFGQAVVVDGDTIFVGTRARWKWRICSPNGRPSRAAPGF